MPEQRTCVCGKSYWWPGARWQHEGCTNGASNNEASNENRLRKVVAEGLSEHGDAAPALGEGPVAARKQRWSREAYNAYQREYMRKRRA